jgi:hypothetical protein
MTLEVSPENSALVRGAAMAILVLHIGGGSVGILSGAMAMVARKGSRLHRRAGHLFFVSMLVMSAIGAAVSPFLPRAQWGNVVAGVFTFYLVATAWATARRNSEVGAFEVGALVTATSVALGGLALGLLSTTHPALISGTPLGALLVFAGIAALAAAGDLRILLRGQPAGRARIVRHLWRMCLALFVAAGSLFLGQPKVFPPPLRGSPVLFLPELAVLVALLFWLVRLRIGKAAAALIYRRPVQPETGI